MKQKKTLIWSRTSPFDNTGTAKMIFDIIKVLNNENLVLFTRPVKKRSIIKIKTYYTHDVFNKKILGALKKFCYLFVLIYKGLKIVKQQNIENIFCIYSDYLFILSAYFIAKISKKKLIIYIIDPLKNRSRAMGIIDYLIMNSFERYFIKHSTLIVLNDDVKLFYKRLYNKKNFFLLNHFCKANLNKIIKNKNLKKNFTILFIGRIYSVNVNKIKIFIKILKNFKKFNFKIITTSKKDYLDKENIKKSSNIKIFYDLNEKEIDRLIDNSDIMYQPLSKSNETPILERLPVENIKYATPRKFIDYLKSNKEILLDCPKDYFISKISKNDKTISNVNKVSEVQNYLKNYKQKKFSKNIFLSRKKIIEKHFSYEKNTKILMNILR